MSFRTDRRYYLTADGKAVEEGDPAGETLLFGMEDEVSAADAKKYGLQNPAEAAEQGEADAVAADEAKAKAAPPANKAKAQASEK